MKERKRPGPAAVLSQPFDETIFYLASREDTYFPPMAGWSLSVLSNNARQSSSVIRFQPALCFLSLCSPSTVLSSFTGSRTSQLTDIPASCTAIQGACRL
ncbi:hypothetical protein V2G26_011893 [Clonostachys chloroleuca]